MVSIIAIGMILVTIFNQLPNIIGFMDSEDKPERVRQMVQSAVISYIPDPSVRDTVYKLLNPITKTLISIVSPSSQASNPSVNEQVNNSDSDVNQTLSVDDKGVKKFARFAQKTLQKFVLSRIKDPELKKLVRKALPDILGHITNGAVELGNRVISSCNNVVSDLQNTVLSTDDIDSSVLGDIESSLVSGDGSSSDISDSEPGDLS